MVDLNECTRKRIEIRRKKKKLNEELKLRVKKKINRYNIDDRTMDLNFPLNLNSLMLMSFARKIVNLCFKFIELVSVLYHNN